jgi:hypothetical protein
MGKSYKDNEEFDPQWRPKRHKTKSKAQELTRFHYDNSEDQYDLLDDEWEEESFEKFQNKR